MPKKTGNRAGGPGSVSENNAIRWYRKTITPRIGRVNIITWAYLFQLSQAFISRPADRIAVAEAADDTSRVPHAMEIVKRWAGTATSGRQQRPCTLLVEALRKCQGQHLSHFREAA
jgi:hypothetical protein